MPASSCSALIIVFLAATRRGRSAMRSTEPWLASVLIVVVLFPHLMWLDRSNGLATLGLRPLQGEDAPVAALRDWLGLIEAILIAHVGLVILVALGSKWHLRTDEKVPVFVRSFTDPFARLFVYYFAIAPGLVAVTVAAFLGERKPVGGIAPHLVLSGLAIIMLAGNAIPVASPAHGRRRLADAAVRPAARRRRRHPAAAVDGLVEHRRVASGQGDGPVSSPTASSAAPAQPLRIVSGETRIAALVAMGSPQRPSLYFYENPERSPWITPADLRTKGLVLVWQGAENEISVPTEHRAALPRPRRRGAARLRAPGAGPAAADPHRLGDATPGIGNPDPAPCSAGERAEAGSDASVRAGTGSRGEARAKPGAGREAVVQALELFRFSRGLHLAKPIRFTHCRPAGITSPRVRGEVGSRSDTGEGAVSRV